VGGIIFALIILIVCIVLILLFVRKRRNKQEQEQDEKNSNLPLETVANKDIKSETTTLNGATKSDTLKEKVIDLFKHQNTFFRTICD